MMGYNGKYREKDLFKQQHKKDIYGKVERSEEARMKAGRQHQQQQQ